MKEEYKNIKLVVFDLDGTLALSKESIDVEMALLIQQLLEKKLVAVIGGGKYELFEQQLISKLDLSEQLLGKLFLFPTTATTFYRYTNGKWQRVYSEELSDMERQRIREAFEIALKELNYVKPEKIYGEQLEDRGSQMSFSFLGQDVVKMLGEKGVELKKKWRDENQEFKLKVAEAVQKLLPNLEVRAAGYTTIDITHRGIDKEYGIKQIKKHLGINFDEMLFVGDALFPGGNDHTVLNTGVDCIQVNDPEDTHNIIRVLIK